MTKLAKQQSGFSLLELIVVVAILTIIMGAAFNLMNSSQVSFDRNQILAEAHQNADFAVLRVTELIRGSGSNPNGQNVVNVLPFISNKLTAGSTADPQVVHIFSDLNGDRDTVDFITGVPAVTTYFLLSSEDITIQFFANDTVVGNVTVPARTICMIDNTAGGVNEGVPIVLAENIVGFSCPVVGANPEKVTLTITGGPSRNVNQDDPRYISFTRICEIRLRNRF